MVRLIEVGDLNGDGILDLVVVEYYAGGLTSSVDVRIGHGDGTFTELASYEHAETAQDVALGDINNDGILDFVGVGRDGGFGSNTTFVRFGQGDGNFGTATVFNDEMNPSTNNTVALGDFNGDGNLDIFSAGPTAFIKLGNGDGSFSLQASFTTQSSAIYGSALADFNADGVLDIFTAGDSGPGEGTVLLGNTRAGVSPLLAFSSALFVEFFIEM